MFCLFHAELPIADDERKGSNVGGEKLGRVEQSWNDEFGMGPPDITHWGSGSRVPGILGGVGGPGSI